MKESDHESLENLGLNVTSNQIGIGLDSTFLYFHLICFEINVLTFLLK